MPEAEIYDEHTSGKIVAEAAGEHGADTEATREVAEGVRAVRASVYCADEGIRESDEAGERLRAFTKVGAQPYVDEDMSREDAVSVTAVSGTVLQLIDESAMSMTDLAEQKSYTRDVLHSVQRKELQTRILRDEIERLRVELDERRAKNAQAQEELDLRQEELRTVHQHIGGISAALTKNKDDAAALQSRIDGANDHVEKISADRRALFREHEGVRQESRRERDTVRSIRHMIENSARLVQSCTMSGNLMRAVTDEEGRAEDVLHLPPRRSNRPPVVQEDTDGIDPGLVEWETPGERGGDDPFHAAEPVLGKWSEMWGDVIAPGNLVVSRRDRKVHVSFVDGVFSVSDITVSPDGSEFTFTAQRTYMPDEPTDDRFREGSDSFTYHISLFQQLSDGGLSLVVEHDDQLLYGVLQRAK